MRITLRSHEGGSSVPEHSPWLEDYELRLCDVTRGGSELCEASINMFHSCRNEDQLIFILISALMGPIPGSIMIIGLNLYLAQ